MIMRLNIRHLFFIFLFLGLFIMTLRPITDPDFWWHLRTGQLIVETHVIPHTDLYSFTNNGKPWVAHEWLTELLIYGLYRLGGYGLLILSFSLTITGAFWLAYLRSPQVSRPYITGFSLLLGAIASAPTWGVRPQMISLFLTSLFLYLLDRYRSEGKPVFLFTLPLITLLWVNLHAGYFLGLAIIAIYIIGSLIDLLKVKFQKTYDPYAPSVKSIRNLCLVLGVCILATLANPNGFHILLYPFQTLTSRAMQLFIQEWFSPDFHLLEWQPLAWFFLAIIGAGMLGKKSISPTKILLTVIFGYAALHSMRHVPLFVIITIPILAEQVGSFLSIRSEAKVPVRWLKWITPFLIVCLVLVVGLRFVQVVQEQSKSETREFPQAAVNWIQQNKPEGNLFNSYNWGGYIIWHLFPQYPVYVDGRADIYGDKFLFAYLDIYHARSGWEKELETQAVRLVLVEPESGLAIALQRSPNWDLVYNDQLCVVYIKR
jgi:hypothetical protein